jgi:uncharacterized membrane-anchored protein YhcB (DUF1043 family)
MSWRVVFTGAIAFLLAAVFGFIAIAIREEYPWLSGVTVLADVGIIVGGLKSVLETTKTANELRKMGFEVEKLKLEIDEKKKAAEKENSRIVVATLDEIQAYSRQINPATATKRGSVIYGGTTALLVILTAGVIGSLIKSQYSENAPRGRSPNVGAAPPDAIFPPSKSAEENRKLEELQSKIEELDSRSKAVNILLNERPLLMVRADVVSKQRQIDEHLSNARLAIVQHDPERASFFAVMVEAEIQQLETLLRSYPH